MSQDSAKIPYLPEPIAGLERLALNLWWRWDRRARLLFRTIDPTIWSATRHNPVATLRMVDPNRLAQLSRDKEFLADYRTVMATLDRALDRNAGWFPETYPELAGTCFAYFCAEYAPLHSWSNDDFDAETAIGELATVALRATGPVALEKTLGFSEAGEVEVTYRWDPAALPSDAWFAPELSLALDPGVTFEPAPAAVWRHDIVTMSKRESGLEETVQGVSITPLWPASLGRASLALGSRPGHAVGRA
ncbi:MAG: DUF3417 domain-containing protein [Gemmatimonadetes bacterium]|nr:DUF3417 domain-containing protein [Gemmatimonadota bacterium]